MKTNFFFLLSLFCMSLFFQSCGENLPNIGNKNEPKKIDCSAAPSTLKNHNPDGVDYIIDCSLELSKNTVTIEPGTVIEFGEGGGIQVEYDGILKAVGTSDKPIIFRKAANNSEGWRGISIRSSKGKNILEHVEIDHAGYGTAYNYYEKPAAVSIEGRLVMKNVLISNTNGTGVVTEHALYPALLERFENIDIQKSSKYPVDMSFELIRNTTLNSCSFTENEEDYIMLRGVYLKSDVVLEAFKTPYLLDGELVLYNGLTLKAGTELAMNPGSTIDIGISNDKAFFKAQGSASNRVTIRGKKSIAGYWKGINISSASSQNIIEHTDISDGGSEAIGYTYNKANITIDYTGNLKLINSSMARSNSDCHVIIASTTPASALEVIDSDIKVCKE